MQIEIYTGVWFEYTIQFFLNENEVNSNVVSVYMKILLKIFVLYNKLNLINFEIKMNLISYKIERLWFPFI